VRAATVRGLRLVPLVVVASTLAAFLPALDGAFLNWDDHVNILGNEAFRGLGWVQIKWMFTTTLLAVYTPLAWMTLGLNYVLSGMNPWGYHLGNLLLHAGNAALVYLVARRLLTAAFPEPGRVDRAAITVGAGVGALVFGVHPLRVESVAWVTERRDVLCAWFYLLAVLAYLRGAAHGGPLPGRWLGASLAASTAALLSKGMAMTLPLTLVLIDIYPLRRSRLGWRVVGKEKVPYAVLALAGAAAAYVAAGRGSAWTGYEEYGPAARLAMVGYSLWFYPWKMVWPHGLSPLYELPAHVDLLTWRFLGPVAGVAAVTAALLLLRRRLPGGLAAWTHSAIVIAPVSGLLHAGHQLASDRWSYLSGLGFALLAGGGIAWTIAQWERGRLGGRVMALVAAGTALAVLGWGAGTWRQCTMWRSSEALWRAAVDVDPACAICRTNLGVAIFRAGPMDAERLAEAEGLFRSAIQLRPGRMDPYSNLGALLAVQTRHAEAAIVFQEVTRRWPGSPEGPLRLAMVYTDHGRPVEAVPLLQQALLLAPGSALARSEMGRALNDLGVQRMRENRLAEATQHFLEAARIETNRLEPLRNLGQALIQQGRAHEASAPLQRALALDPQDAQSRFWLARAFWLTGDRARAQAEAAALHRMDPDLAAQLTVDR